MLAGEGLQSSSKGARVKFSGNQRSVTNGPFLETKELSALWEQESWPALRQPRTVLPACGF